MDYGLTARTMTHWTEDETVWGSLDDLIDMAWLPLKDLLDRLHDHSDQLAQPTQALLFGGLGLFSMTYKQMRTDGHPPITAYEGAMLSIQRDRRIQQMMAATAQRMVDTRVDEMGGV